MFVHRSSQKQARRRGQAMVEMALVVTVLLFLALGLIQFSLLVNSRIALTNLAREGARYAAVHPEDSDSNIKNKVVAAAQNTTLSDIVAEQVKVTPGSDSRFANQPVTITVTYNLGKKLLGGVATPGISGWGDTTASAVMVLQSDG